MEVSELPGVQSVIADQATQQTTIVFDDPATEEQIKSLLSEINYPVSD
jgi:copper chaperone CopZ